MVNFRSLTLNALFWSIGAQAVQQILQFAITVILARILNPDDFGLIGMIVVFTGFAQIR